MKPGATPAGALVTGGSGGLGAAIVQGLAAARPVVFTHLGDPAGAARLEAALAGGRFAVHALESDAGDPAAVERMQAAASAELGGPAGVLVCCAGITRDAMSWKLTPEDWEAVLRTNLTGAWLALRAVAPGMRAAGWGRVVLIGSINGSRGKAGQTAYAASKAGLHGLARSAARELGPRGITVNVVEPGWIDTAMTRAVPPEFREAARAETVTGRLGTPQDVAAVVAFLCSEGAGHVTGQILRVDGGQFLG